MTPTCDVTSYAALYNADTTNYEDKEVTITLTLEQAVASVVWTYDSSNWTDSSKTVDYSNVNYAYRITATYVDSANNKGDMTLTYAKGSETVTELVNAGNYTITAAPTAKNQADGKAIDFNTNYTFTGNTEKTFAINKAVVALSEIEYSVDHSTDNDGIVSITPTVVNASDKTIVISSDNYTLGYIINENSVGFTIGKDNTHRNGRIMDHWTIGFTDGGTWKLSVTLSSQNYEMAETTITIKVKSVVLSTDHNTLYNIDEKLYDATSGDVVIVKYNTYINQEATVKSGVTLLVPYDSTYTNQAQTIGTGSGSGAYRTLTVNSKLFVLGTVNVSGIQGAGQPNTGFVSGKYGYMILNAYMEIQKNGILYATGYIKGDGSIYLNSGATCYENFEIFDWPGGTVAIQQDRSDFFPVSQYKIANIHSIMTVNYGANLMVFYYMSVSGEDIKGEVTMFGNGGLFVLSSAGYITKEVKNSKIELNVYGEVETSNISITIKISIISHTCKTNDTYIPICGYYDIVAKKKSIITVKSKFKFLPGSTFTIEEDADCTITASGGIVGYTGIDSETKQYEDYTTIALQKDGTEVATYGKYSSSDVKMIINGKITVNKKGLFAGYVTTNTTNSTIILSSSSKTSITITKITKSATDDAFAATMPWNESSSEKSFLSELSSNESTLSAGETYKGNGSYFVKA